MDMEAMATKTVGSGVTEGSRFTGPTATDITAVTGVHTGEKGNHHTPTTPRTERYRSVVRRSTAKEVGWDDCWRRIKRMGVYDRRFRVMGFNAGYTVKGLTN